jgi:AcrR family transcriptional regulator
MRPRRLPEEGSRRPDPQGIQPDLLQWSRWTVGHRRRRALTLRFQSWGRRGTAAAPIRYRRDLIVAKAAALFARRGYLGTTISDVTDACGLQKATLYHYFKDKEELLMSIADLHVSKLVNLVRDVEAQTRSGPERLQSLITRFLSEYANAQDAHRVLTEDVKYLPENKRSIIVQKERQVVAVFSSAIAATRPGIKRAKLEKPVAMLLFGMLNWMFTWLRPEGRLTHDDMAPVVVQLLLGGLENLVLPRRRKATARNAHRTMR